MLNEQQVERYSRQIILPQLGGRGQQTLLSASVAVVGSGDMSTAAALYLAAAGIGRLTLSEPSPLSAITAMNPDCRVDPLPPSMTPGVTAELARHCSVIVASGVPSEICNTLNAACVARCTTLVWGDTVGPLGLVTVFRPDRNEFPCYTCAHKQLAQLLVTSDATDGLTEATAAFIGTLQATEAIKDLLGLDRPPTTRAMVYDAVTGTMGDVPLARDPSCRTCAAVRP
jgi:molybdopterin/thiamine biosynthesis adenylyltransferase